MEVRVIERAQQISLQEMSRMERQLEAQVRRPAEAEKFRLERIAAAQRQQLILEAEAQAEAVRVSAALAVVARALLTTRS